MVLRVAVVGAGALGWVHMRTALSTPGVELTRVCDPGLSGDREAAVRRTGAQVVPFTEVLDPRAIDALIVATPTDSHAEIVTAAVANDIAVFCEKPLARTLAEAQAVQRAAGRPGAKVAVGHVVRYFPEYVMARDLVTSGRLGTPATARLSRVNTAPAGAGPWYADAARSGGVLLDMAVHDVDWCRWTFGPVSRVFAVRAGSPGREVASITLRHASGVISYIDSSWRNETFATSLELWGGRGFFRTDGSASAGFTAAVQRSGAGYLPSASADLPPDDPFRLELEAAFAWFRGGPAPLATADDGAEAVRLIDAAERSVRTGLPIQLDGAAR